MAPVYMSAFDLYRDQVEGMMKNEGELFRVEQALEHSDLPAEERDALWLLAWALGRRRLAAGYGGAPTGGLLAR
ncbi:MAG: hypothetical protein QOC95_2628 [Thermoleophilaceae bacterium]|jgi:hypothetical protein|nr:hypothetical protein [Thermoleophilaceae bacterium]